MVKHSDFILCSAQLYCACNVCNFTHCPTAALPVTSSAAPEGHSLGSPDWLPLQPLGPLCLALLLLRNLEASCLY